MSQEIVARLVDGRAQLAGEIELAQIELRRKIADLDSLDAAIRVFAPHLATETPRLGRIPPQHQALRGGVKATIMAAVTAAGVPTTTDTIARQLLENRKLPLDDPGCAACLSDGRGKRFSCCRGKGGCARSEGSAAGVGEMSRGRSRRRRDRADD